MDSCRFNAKAVLLETGWSSAVGWLPAAANFACFPHNVYCLLSSWPVKQIVPVFFELECTTQSTDLPPVPLSFNTSIVADSQIFVIVERFLGKH